MSSEPPAPGARPGRPLAAAFASADTSAFTASLVEPYRKMLQSQLSMYRVANPPILGAGAAQAIQKSLLGDLGQQISAFTGLNTMAQGAVKFLVQDQARRIGNHASGNVAAWLLATQASTLAPFAAQGGMASRLGFASRIARSLGPDMRHHQMRLLRVSGFQDALREASRPVAARSIRRVLFPPNWRDLPPSTIMGILGAIEERATPLAWVPREEVLWRIVAAPDLEAEDLVLVTRQAEILEDCLAVLEQVTDLELHDLAYFAEEAVNTLPISPPAAQALATVVFDSLLHLDPGWSDYNRFRQQLVQPSEAPLGYVRTASATWPLFRVLKHRKPGSPIYSRHVTFHGASLVQLTPANAIRSVMLTTSLLREVQESGWF